VTRIHQVLSGAGPYDAVTTQALRWRELLARRGFGGGVHAAAIEPRVRRRVAPLGQLEPRPDDLTVLHYSAHAPHLGRVLDQPGRKLLVHHNVTPARYLWEHAPNVAAHCALGRRELPRYLEAADAVAAVSAYNARELEEAGAREVSVVPILLDPARLAERGEPPPARLGDRRNPHGPLVLVVGRLVPSKRHDLALLAFAAYRRACAPDARLLCVGEPLTPAYRRLVEGLADRAGAGAGAIAGGVPQPQLNAAYAAASVLLSTSDHEGFCVPLLEAFSFDLPVVARPAGGMPEVAGDTVLWAYDEPFDPAVAAELIDLAVRDRELAGELARRGRARLEEYAPHRVAERIVATVEGALER
jgi:glycosyltransferase involved in cell wall biosynthesis